MFPVTITLKTPAELNLVMAALGATAKPEAVEVKVLAPEPAAPTKKTEKLSASQQAAVDDTAGLEPAPVKSAAATAPTPPTAKAEAVAAPEKTAAASAPSAASAAPAPQASTAATEPVTYAQLQAAVLKLHKLDPTAAKPIAEAMGFANFKAMPEDKWGEALAAVQAALSERGV